CSSASRGTTPTRTRRPSPSWCVPASPSRSASTPRRPAAPSAVIGAARTGTSPSAASPPERASSTTRPGPGRGGTTVRTQAGNRTAGTPAPTPEGATPDDGNNPSHDHRGPGTNRRARRRPPRCPDETPLATPAPPDPTRRRLDRLAPHGRPRSGQVESLLRIRPPARQRTPLSPRPRPPLDRHHRPHLGGRRHLHVR